MSDIEHERRISTVEANYTNLSESMARVEGYLGKLFDQQGDIKTSVALVIQNQDGMKDYQKKCDIDRQDYDKRITATEGFQTRLVKYALLVTGIGSLASPQLSKIWGKIFS